MFYYLYEIKNNLNGKIYVGVHETRDMNDGYMGSGKVLKCAIKKYGIDNFTKTVLKVFQSSEDMYASEAEVVNEEFLLLENVYNVIKGGKGGWEYVHQNNMHLGFKGRRHSETSKKLIGEKSINRRHDTTSKQRMSNNSWAKRDPEKQKEHATRAAKIANENRTEETLQKISSTVTEKWKLIPTVTCPHCGKEGRGGTMVRWHFDNCKMAN